MELTATLEDKGWTPSQVLRRLTQAGFALFILISSLRHNLVTDQHLASIDAYCPFGGFETLWRWLSTGGLFVQKTHQSNLVLLLGLITGVILAGGAFCGWVCPFGALQDLLDWVRRKLRLPEIHVPARLDRLLTYGRYVTLFGILYATVSTVKLWFADYDPYRTIFSLGWLFEFNLAEHWPAYIVALAIIAGSLFIRRMWCRYLCPLGGAISILGNLSLLRIRRVETDCLGCAVCNTPCPVKIDVAQASPAVSADCIGCLECVEACPRHGALSVTLGPAIPRAFKPTTAKKERHMKAIRVNKYLMPVLVVFALLGSVWVAKAAGVWQTSGRGQVLLDRSGQPDPMGIKGWMTLGNISETYGIPLDAVYVMVGASSDIPPDTALKELEKLVSGMEVWAVREAVAGYLASQSANSVPEVAPTAIPTPLPSPTPLPEPTLASIEEYTPVGPGAGMGQGQGQDHVEGSGSGITLPEDGSPLPGSEIKGRLTLQEVIEYCQVPQGYLITELGLPDDIDTQIRMRDLAGQLGIEVSVVRDVVSRYQEGN